MQRNRMQLAEFVIASFQRLGVVLRPQSRLQRMHRALTFQERTIPLDDPDFETALEAERDLQVIEYVLEQEHATSAHPRFVRLLHALADDPVLPQKGSQQSKGRDTQFELFVAAICQAAAFLPVDYAEPDVTCTCSGQRIAIAAKRLKSVGQLQKRISEAGKQISRSGLPGIIAIDTTIGLNPRNDRITKPIADEEFARLYCEAIMGFLRQHESMIRRCIREKPVLGLLVHDHQVRVQTDGSWSLTGMTARLCTAQDSERTGQFEAFARAYVAAMPNMTELS